MLTCVLPAKIPTEHKGFTDNLLFSLRQFLHITTWIFEFFFIGVWHSYSWKIIEKYRCKEDLGLKNGSI